MGTVGSDYTPGPGAEDITVEKDGGILKEIKVAGTGSETPWSGDRVFVHYVGTLTDGSKFDSSRDRGDQFSFNIGKSEVIKGWDVGVATMKRGEKAVFTIKSDYGYGSAGSPPKIPGDATLIFEIELFDFHGEDITKDSDMGVVKRIKCNGEGYDQPNDGSQVEIELKGFNNGNVFDDRKVAFEVGEGLDSGIPRGIEFALEKMKAKIFKEKGTKHFKHEKYEIASTRYQKVIDFLEHEISLKGEAEVERKSLLQAGRLNLALCYLKLQKWMDARTVCDKVIEESAATAKAWFRRGEAQLALNDCEAAKKDFEKSLELEPDNKAAKNKVVICQQKIKAQKDKEKRTFANMFDKFAEIDKKKEALEKQKRPDAMNNIDQWNSGGDSGIASDPNSIKVGGDVNMSMDINEAIKADVERQEEA